MSTEIFRTRSRSRNDGTLGHRRGHGRTDHGPRYAQFSIIPAEPTTAMNRLSSIVMTIALCMAASAGRAETDPIATYCALLKDRIHQCMRAYFGPQRSVAKQTVCAMAPGLIKAKLNDALDALPS